MVATGRNKYLGDNHGALGDNSQATPRLRNPGRSLSHRKGMTQCRIIKDEIIRNLQAGYMTTLHPIQRVVCGFSSFSRLHLVAPAGAIDLPHQEAVFSRRQHTTPSDRHTFSLTLRSSTYSPLPLAAPQEGSPSIRKSPLILQGFRTHSSPRSQRRRSTALYDDDLYVAPADVEIPQCCEQRRDDEDSL